MPLFTIVMPCFRARDVVATAVASVLAQSEPDFELVVVDDGSPDDTVAVALRAAAGDPRVRCVAQSNQGPSAARNTGIAAGTGRLVAFLDADDRWSPDLLERHQRNFAANRRLGVSFARVRFYDPALLVPGRTSAARGRLELAEVLGENPVCTSSNIVARRAVFEQVGGFDAAMNHAEDQEWVARVLAASDWQVHGIDAVLVDYRTSTGGLSADLDRMQAGWCSMLERVRRYAPAAVAATEPQARALFERYLARRALRTRQPAARALGHLISAVRHSPTALLTHQPARTLLTTAGALAAVLLPAALLRNAVTR